MKTKSFLLGAAALMLATSCSNDEVVKVAENSAAIGFSSFVNNSTRATDNTYDNLENLKVWGVTSRGTEVAPVEIFDGELVKKETAEAGTGVWTYSPLRYWIAGNAYSFAAVAPAAVVGEELTVEQSLAEDWTEAGLTLTFDNEAAKAEKDILYAKADVPTATATNAAVGLNLKHMLSRVRFQFINEFTTGEKIRISNVKILDATAKADITKAEATGTWSNPVGTFEVLFGVPENDGMTVTTDHMYLIPLTEATAYNISFTVELLSSNGVDVLVSYDHKGTLVEGTEDQYTGISLGAVNFKNNSSYTFKATINPSNVNPEDELHPIEFTATVGDWADWTENEVPVVEKPAE